MLKGNNFFNFKNVLFEVLYFALLFYDFQIKIFTFDFFFSNS